MTNTSKNVNQTTSSSSCTYRFIPSSLVDLPKERDYEIIIRQQPQRAKMSVVNERDRRPIEPPPILQMKWLNCSDEDIKKSLQSPFYFLVANLVPENDPEKLLIPSQDYLSGSTVSSLYRLRDIDNSDGGFFVFGDLAVKKEGKYRLHFSLFEIVEGNVQNRKTLLSDVFTVYLPKRYPGPTEATFLSRTFCDQGVKMRIRKEHRLPSVSSRKRKLENAQNEVSTTVSNKENPTEVDDRPAKRKGANSPTRAYATKQTQQEVHFGRWQSTKQPSPSLEQHQQTTGNAMPGSHIIYPQPRYGPPTSPVHSSSVSHDGSSMYPSPTSQGYHTMVDSRHRAMMHQPQSINELPTSNASFGAHPPPPPSTVYASSNSGKSGYDAYSHYRSYSWYDKPYSLPYATHSIPSPPPSTSSSAAAGQFSQTPCTSDLSYYHFDNNNRQTHPNPLARQLTPPPVLADIVTVDPSKTTKRVLPPLHAIMSETLRELGDRTPVLPPPSLNNQHSSPSSSPSSTARVSIDRLLFCSESPQPATPIHQRLQSTPVDEAQP